MKKLEFTRDVFASGFKVFAKGQQVDPSPELQKHVRRGDAKEVDVPDPKPTKPEGKSDGKDAGKTGDDGKDAGAGEKGKK